MTLRSGEKKATEGREEERERWSARQKVDVSTVETVKKDLAGWRLNRVVYVADGGCMSEANLQILARGGSGYILGVPLRKSKEAAQVLARPGCFRTVAENLQVKEVQVPSAGASHCSFGSVRAIISSLERPLVLES